ncbi:putative vacuolar membrane protein [Candida tropicalis]
MRHPKQQEFLKHVGDQIYIIKLQGSLFFGSIGGVEKVIKNLFEEEKFSLNPISYLIIDMKGVISLDFSAAEGFRRILNLTNSFKTQLIISSVSEDDDITQGLRDAGLFDNGTNSPIELFSSLNYALEWCENSFLKTYKKLKKTGLDAHSKSKSVPTSTGTRQPQFQSPSSFGAKLFGKFGELGTTPRSNQVLQAASKTVYDEHKTQSKFEVNKNSLFQKQPLSLMMITFQGLSKKDAEFWAKLAPYFVKEKVPENYQFYDTKTDDPAFFIVESGLIRSTDNIHHGE